MVCAARRFLGSSPCFLLMVVLSGCATAPTGPASARVETVYSPQPGAGVETAEAAKKDLAELLATKNRPGIKCCDGQFTNTLAGEEALIKELLPPQRHIVIFLYDGEELRYVLVPAMAALEDRIEVSPAIAFSYDDLPDYTIVVEKTPDVAPVVRTSKRLGVPGTNDLGPTRRPFRIQFPGKMAFFFGDLGEAQRFADDLFVIQQDLKKEHDQRLALFESKAAAYRALTAKPPVPEEQRKLIVQANALNEQKDYPGAIKLYLQAIDRDPVSYPGAYFNLALLSAQVKRYNVAIGYMKQYLQLVPEAADARSAQDKIYEWELKVQSRK